MTAALQGFADRGEAGRALADALADYRNRDDVIVLALPRGGVPVAAEVARSLPAPMDLWIVRKLGTPGNEELAMGALAGDDVIVLNDEVIDYLHIDEAAIGRVLAREKAEMERRNALYRAGRPPPDVAGKTVIVVDDGLATGSTMRAAVLSLRQARAARIIVAVPVGEESTCRALEREADEVVCLCRPAPFYGVGQWYDDFSQTPDSEVRRLLARSPPLHSGQAT